MCKKIFGRELVGCVITALFLIVLVSLLVQNLLPIPFSQPIDAQNKQELPFLLSGLLIVLTWFFGILFSTFTKALGARLRDGIE